MGNKATTAVLAGCLLLGVLTGCAAPAGPATPPAQAGLSAEDKTALDNPLFSAEMMTGGICSSTITRSDPDANRCAAMLTQTTAKIAAVHELAVQHGVHDALLDTSADVVSRFAQVCDPHGSSASISSCLDGAAQIKSNATTYVQELRAKLDAVK